MARTNNLTNFLTDVADAIKEKKGDNTPIAAADFDTEIANIETVGNYQEKEITITQNGNFNLLPDTGYDAMSNVRMSIDVAGDPMDPTTALADDVLNPKTFYSNGQKLTGAIRTTYGQILPTKIITSFAFDTSINLWDIDYHKKIAVINSGGTTFGLAKIIDNQIDYATRVDFTREDVGMTYSIMNAKISPTNSNSIVLWIFGKAGGGGNNAKNYHSVTRCVINYLDLSITSYKTEEYYFGPTRQNAYASAPRPQYDTDAAVMIGWNNYSPAYTTVRVYRYDEETDSFLIKTENRAQTYNSLNLSTLIWGYWTEDGEYLLTYSNYTSHCSIDKVDSNGVGIRKYASATQRRVFKGGYYLQGTTVYNEDGQAVGTSVVNFSGNTTNLSIFYPFIFIRDNAQNTSMYRFTEDYNIIKVKDITTYSDLSFTKANDVYLYNIGGRLDGYYTDFTQEVIKMTRDHVDFYKLTEANGTQADILTGKKVYDNNGVIVGTMPNNGVLSYTPGLSDQNIPAGYTSGGVIFGDANLLSGNIKNGISLFGVTGTFAGMVYYIQLRLVSEYDSSTCKVSVLNATYNPDTDLWKTINTDNVIQVELPGMTYTETISINQDVIVTITVPNLFSVLHNDFTTDYAVYGNMNSTLSTYGSPTIGTYANRQSLNVSGACYVQYSLPSLSDYDIQFDFYKSNSDSYPRLIYVGGPGYEIEIKGASNAIYWGGEYSVGWLQNQWNKFRLKKSGSSVTLYINGVSKATRTYSANATSVRIGTGSSATSNVFNGYISNMMVKGNFTENSISMSTQTTSFVNLDLIVADSTLAELQADTNYRENTIGIVFGTEYVGTYKLIDGAWVNMTTLNESEDIFDILNYIADTSDTYTGNGGTDEQINTLVNYLVGGI